jgi:tetratricopeptide (TPR) repeat protein
MTARILIATILATALLMVGCGRRTVVSVPLATTPTAESLNTEGVSAFHEGTPEGYTRAVDAFRRASKLKGDRCEYALNLAQSLLFLATEQLLNWEEYEPRQTEAAGIVDAAGATCMSYYEPFLLRLRALIAGRGPAATELINRAVDLDSADAMNWVVLGYLDPQSRRLVSPDGAGRWIAMGQAAKLLPGSALIQYELGKNYQTARGKESDAKPAFERTVELSPRHFRAYLGLAYTADENVDVEPLYQKVVDIAPSFLEGRLALGSYYAALDEIDKAAGQYSAALTINPRYDIAHFRLGLLMLQAERMKEAEQHFRAVIELNPGSYEAYYHLGNIVYGRKEFDEARKQYEQALKIRVNYAEAEYGIGWVYRQQDQTDLALAQFDKVIRLQPRYGDAYLSRGDIRAERRQFHEALTDYQKAIEAYEEQIKSFAATIAFAEARSQSRIMQSEKKRAERDKARIEALVELARRYKSELEDNR